MIDTAHVSAPPDDIEKAIDALLLRMRSSLLPTKISREKVDVALVDCMTTIWRLVTSAAPEVTQSVAPIVTNAQAGRRFLDHQPPALDEVRQALNCIVRDGYRANDVIHRIRELLEGSVGKVARGH